MNEKSMNRKDLEAMFNRYRNVMNFNQVDFMGKISDYGGKATKENPFYYEIPQREEGQQDYWTVKATIDVPSPVRVNSLGEMYKTRLPIFSTGDMAIEYKNIITKDTKYIRGIGRVQNFKVKSQIQEQEDIGKFVYNVLSDMNNGNVDLTLFKEVKQILRISGDVARDDELTLTNIWSNYIEDCTDVAEKLVEEGVLPQYNRVLLQGLVFMPPSIRRLNDGGMSLHVKVRVRRHNDEGQPIPYAHRVGTETDPDGYDYINVIAFGDKVEEWYGQIKQGHPILLSGRLESSRFKQKKTVIPVQERQLVAKLGVLPDNPFIQKIKDYIYQHGGEISCVNYNVWANNIITDEKMLFAEKVDETFVPPIRRLCRKRSENEAFFGNEAVLNG